MKTMLKTCFYLLLSILGLSYLSLLLFIGAQLALGKVAPGQLVTMLRVLDGQRFYTLPTQEYDDFKAFQNDREALREEMIRQYGPPDERAPGAQLVAAERRHLEEELAVAKRELDQAKADVLTAGRTIDRLQAQLDGERKMFASQVAKEAAAMQLRGAEAYKRLLSNMGAEALGEMVERISQSSPDEAARMMRDAIPPDVGGEIMDDLPIDVRLRVIPLIEDLNKGLPPRETAAHFMLRREREGTYAMGPLEIYQQLRHMNAAKAMATYLLLNDELREEVGRYILNPPAN